MTGDGPEGETLSGASLESSANAQRLAIQYYRAGNLRDALTEAKKAANIDRQNIKLHNLVGAISNETHDPGTAVQYLRHSLSMDEHQIEAQFLLGNALMTLGLNEEAVQAYDMVLIMDPKHIFTHVNMSQCLNTMGQHSKSERALHRALDIDPVHPDANNMLADVYIRKTQYGLGEKHARIALEAAPDRIPIILTLAKALRLLNRFAEAEEYYRSALHVHPNDATLLVELGNVLREQDLYDAADEHFETALKLAPKDLKVLRGAGAYFQSIRRHDRALALYEKFVELNPDDTGMLNNLAIVLRDMNRFEEAEEYYLKCAELEAHPSYVYNNLGILAMEMGKPEESIEYYRKAIEDNPNYDGAHSNMLFFMNYLDSMTSQELYEEHKAWQAHHTEPIRPEINVFPNSLEPDRPLRIGYVSADFYGHSVSYFIEAALKHHDSTKFEIYCYAHLRTPDAITKRLQSYTNHWRAIFKMKTEEVADIIRKDEIDILVDLGGHTAGNRLKVFALKPAPIQVTWIGYPNTTGLDTMDYRFVDHVTDPVGEADECHTETLWRLPNSFTCYNSQYAQEPSRVLAAKTTGQITFGSFNNTSKLSESSIEAWAKILKKAKGSRLIMKSASLVDGETCDRFRALFKKHGVAAKRVEFYGKMSSADHMNFYANIDICLDPFPYNGTTTSCESLWMNVPIIALLGDRHSARVTASLLTQVGLGDLAAKTTDDYVDVAVKLAKDTDRLEKIHQTLREDMANSSLCDHEGHTRGVEDAYRGMWHKWCEDEAPRRIERVKRGKPEASPSRPTLRILHSLGNYSFVQFCKCLGAMGEICMLNDLHPLGTSMFPPLLMGQERYKFFSDEEWKIVSRKKVEFKDTIARLLTRVEERGKELVITDWCHLDYVAQPYLPAPNFQLATTTDLKDMYDLKEIFVMRHPMSQWATYCRETNVDVHITVEEFLRGFRHMAERALEGNMIRCEDFVENPDDVLRSACEHLELPFSLDYRDNWPFNLEVPSSSNSMCLEDRANEQLSAGMPTDLPAPVVEQMKNCPDYAIILDMLGYE
jgi:protein O-GlcNAc transferase